MIPIHIFIGKNLALPHCRGVWEVTYFSFHASQERVTGKKGVMRLFRIDSPVSAGTKILTCSQYVRVDDTAINPNMTGDLWEPREAIYFLCLITFSFCVCELALCKSEIVNKSEGKTTKSV